MARRDTTDVSELVKYIKRHAAAHYEDGGWDVVVECWEDAEIARVLRGDGARNEAEALASFKPMVGIWAERQADAENSAF